MRFGKRWPCQCTDVGSGAIQHQTLFAEFNGVDLKWKFSNCTSRAVDRFGIANPIIINITIVLVFIDQFTIDAFQIIRSCALKPWYLGRGPVRVTRIKVMVSRDVHLADVRIFVFASEKGSLAAAALALGVPRASASRQLQRLEASLGRTLLHRAAGRFALTEEGRTFLPSAHRLLANLDQAVAELRSHEGPLRGLLRISAPYAFGRTKLAPCIADFLAQHPQVDIALDLGDLHVDLLADEADLALRIGDVSGDSLITRVLTTETMVLCAAPAYLSAYGSPTVLDDLAQHRVLAMGAPTASGDLDIEHQDGSYTFPGPLALRTKEPSVLAAAARRAAGIAYLPQTYVANDLHIGALATVLPDVTLQPLKVNAVYAPGRRQSRTVRAFLDLLLEHMEHRSAFIFPAGMNTRLVAR